VIGPVARPPREDHRRGGHVALGDPQAEALCQQLHERDVIGDRCRPDLLRLRPSPLHTSFEDCFEVIERLKAILDRIE
jgi:kynureninase